MRIHCLENVDKALQFLKEQRVHLENMGSHDIVDGNHRLTLGLIWTIILRFQVRRACWTCGSAGQCSSGLRGDPETDQEASRDVSGAALLWLVFHDIILTETGGWDLAFISSED